MNDNQVVPEVRKASEVLLSIEEKVNSIHQSLTLFNTTNKLILERLNKVYNYIDKLEKEIELEKMANAQPQVEQTVHMDIPLQIEQNPVGTRRTSRIENQTPEQPVRVEVKAEQKTEIKHTSERKVPVVQRITNHEGKDLFNAEVSIMTENKELVAKIRTGATGKWQALIPPGNYIVHVVKTNNDRTKIEALQNITVPDSNTPVVLPLAAIKKT